MRDMTVNPKYKYVCAQCGKENITHIANKRLCSDDCRKNFYDRTSYQFPIASGSVGAIAEMYVCSDLLKKGYAVFRAVSSSTFADVLAIKESEIRIIEVRTGYTNPSKGEVSFPKVIHHRNNNRPSEYAIFIASENSIQYIPITDELFNKYKKKYEKEKS